MKNYETIFYSRTIGHSKNEKRSSQRFQHTHRIRVTFFWCAALLLTADKPTFLSTTTTTTKATFFYFTL
jgi:hypothetical protein